MSMQNPPCEGVCGLTPRWPESSRPATASARRRRSILPARVEADVDQQRAVELARKRDGGRSTLRDEAWGGGGTSPGRQRLNAEPDTQEGECKNERFHRQIRKRGEGG